MTNLYQWALRMERSDKRQKGGVPIGHTPSEDDGELATRSMNSSYWLRW